jgi:soluble P-type ATPase
MIQIDIPGFTKLQLNHLVLDYNGTLACDGRLIPGVREYLKSLAEKIAIHVLTADTFGGVGGELEGMNCRVFIIGAGDQDRSKLQYVEDLGPEGVVCIGNGRNDRLMLKEAALGIAVVQTEGAAAETLLAADVVCYDIISALELLLNPLRLAATLRL